MDECVAPRGRRPGPNDRGIYFLSHTHIGNIKKKREREKERKREGMAGKKKGGKIK